MSNDFVIESTYDKNNEVLETIKEVPEVEKENGMGSTGESDVSQSTLAVSEDSTINTEDFTIYEDTNITVQELIKQKIALLGENINIGRFARFEV